MRFREDESQATGSETETDSDDESHSGSESQRAADVASELGVPFVSSVAIITADFAMQNVIMQMGLRLVTPDGRRITRLSCWVLRCSACFTVTKVCGPWYAACLCMPHVACTMYSTHIHCRHRLVGSHR